MGRTVLGWGVAGDPFHPTHLDGRIILQTRVQPREVNTYNSDCKVVHVTDDQSSSSTATLEYFEYGGFESLNKIPVARLSDGVLLNLQLLFTFEWQFTIEKRLVLVIVANKRYERMLEKLAKIGKDKVLKRPRDKEKMR